jgi:hypothetical protein
MEIVEGCGHGMLNDSLGFEVVSKALFAEKFN